MEKSKKNSHFQDLKKKVPKLSRDFIQYHFVWVIDSLFLDENDINGTTN